MKFLGKKKNLGILKNVCLTLNVLLNVFNTKYLTFRMNVKSFNITNFPQKYFIVQANAWKLNQNMIHRNGFFRGFFSLHFFTS